MNFKPIRTMLFVSPLSAILLFASVSLAADGDVCGLEDVIQPAIDDAADQNGCNADGVYIAPNVILDAAAEKCRVGFSATNRCRRCLREEASRGVNLLKLLAKQRYLEPSSVTALKRGFYDLNRECESQPQNPSSGTSSSIASSPEGGSSSSEDNHSGDNSSGQTSSGGAGMNLDQLRDAVEQACPCHGAFNTRNGYMHCVELKLSQLITANQVDRDVARIIYQQSRLSDCGLPPPTGGRL